MMNKRANFTANSEFPEGGDQGGGNEGVSAGPSSTSAPPFMSRLVHANNPTAGAPLATDATAETGFVLEGSSSLFDCEAGGASARLRGAEVIRTNIFRLVSMVNVLETTPFHFVALAEELGEWLADPRAYDIIYTSQIMEALLAMGKVATRFKIYREVYSQLVNIVFALWNRIPIEFHASFNKMTDRLRDYKNSYQPTVNPANYSNSLSPTLQPHPLRTELSHVQPSALLQSASSSPSSVHLPTTTSSPSIPMSSPYIQHNGSSFSATNTRQLNTAQHHQRLKQQLKFVEQLKLNQLLQKQDQQQQMIRNELTALINDGLQMSPSLQESFFQMNHEQQLQQILEMKATRQLQIQKRKERQLEQQQHHHEARIQHDAANLALNQSKQQHAQSLPSQPQRVESSHTQILWNGVLVWSMNDPVAGTAKEVQSMALMKNVNMLNFPASKPEHCFSHTWPKKLHIAPAPIMLDHRIVVKAINELGMPVVFVSSQMPKDPYFSSLQSFIQAPVGGKDESVKSKVLLIKLSNSNLTTQQQQEQPFRDLNGLLLMNMGHILSAIVCINTQVVSFLQHVLHQDLKLNLTKRPALKHHLMQWALQIDSSTGSSTSAATKGIPPAAMHLHPPMPTSTTASSSSVVPPLTRKPSFPSAANVLTNTDGSAVDSSYAINGNVIIIENSQSPARLDPSKNTVLAPLSATSLPAGLFSGPKVVKRGLDKLSTEEGMVVESFNDVSKRARLKSTSPTKKTLYLSSSPIPVTTSKLKSPLFKSPAKRSPTITAISPGGSSSDSPAAAKLFPTIYAVSGSSELSSASTATTAADSSVAIQINKTDAEIVAEQAFFESQRGMDVVMSAADLDDVLDTEKVKIEKEDAVVATTTSTTHLSKSPKPSLSSSPSVTSASSTTLSNSTKSSTAVLKDARPVTIKETASIDAATSVTFSSINSSMVGSRSFGDKNKRGGTIATTPIIKSSPAAAIKLALVNSKVLDGSPTHSMVLIAKPVSSEFGSVNAKIPPLKPLSSSSLSSSSIPKTSRQALTSGSPSLTKSSVQENKHPSSSTTATSLSTPNVTFSTAAATASILAVTKPVTSSSYLSTADNTTTLAPAPTSTTPSHAQTKSTDSSVKYDEQISSSCPPGIPMDLHRLVMKFKQPLTMFPFVQSCLLPPTLIDPVLPEVQVKFILSDKLFARLNASGSSKDGSTDGPRYRIILRGYFLSNPKQTQKWPKNLKSISVNGQNISFFRRFRYEVISPSTSSSTAVNSDSNNAADAHVIGASAKKYDTYGFDVEAALQDLAKPGENTVTLYFGKVKKPEQGWGISIEFDKQAGLAQLPLSTLKMDAAIENVNRFIDRKGEVAEVNGTAQGKEACVTVSLLDTESKKIIAVFVRGKNCDHLEGFDLATWIENRAKKREFWCPVCSRRTTIDVLIRDILLEEKCRGGKEGVKDRITLFKDDKGSVYST